VTVNDAAIIRRKLLTGLGYDAYDACDALFLSEEKKREKKRGEELKERKTGVINVITVIGGMGTVASSTRPTRGDWNGPGDHPEIERAAEAPGPGVRATARSGRGHAGGVAAAQDYGVTGCSER
jgi:hypothetical protein